MKFKDIVKRLIGIESPVFEYKNTGESASARIPFLKTGASWIPTDSDKRIATKVINFLENRRVLYNPSEMEVPHHCVSSVVEIRNFLTEQIPQSTQNELTGSLKAMRIACRKFLDLVGERDEITQFGSSHGHWASWQFNGAIGELRGVFGVHLAKIAGMYGLDVEDDLASIFPETEESDSDPSTSNKKRKSR